MYHGIINVYKEPGYTSHDVVARLRGILKQKKIGHTGTLDPAAEGVLPVTFRNGHKTVRYAGRPDKDLRGSASFRLLHRYAGYYRNDPYREPGKSPGSGSGDGRESDSGI